MDMIHAGLAAPLAQGLATTRPTAAAAAGRSGAVVEVDGAAGEGGGQILRSALSLAMCTGRALHIRRIRAGRAKPGLMRQHLACVQAAQAICGAEVDGAHPGAQELHFTPGPVRAGEHEFRTGSAGSCTLVLQTVLPALMSATAGGPSRLLLAGGTHNPLAPPFHFIERCWAPLLRRLGVGLDLNLRRHGFYPAGGGEFTAVITPPANGQRLQPFDVLERGAPVEHYAECLLAGVPANVAHRELSALLPALGWGYAQVRATTLRQNEGPGNVLVATLVHEQVSEVVTAFGQKGVSSEQIAERVVRELRAYQAGSGALGVHLADQWLLPLALAVVASGRPAAFSCTELSLHARSNIDVITQFLPVQVTVERLAGAVRVDVVPG
ncbi:MAG: hypothetical protein RIQ60_2891 [Pseudomonadota bacterium]